MSKNKKGAEVGRLVEWILQYFRQKIKLVRFLKTNKQSQRTQSTYEAPILAVMFRRENQQDFVRGDWTQG